MKTLAATATVSLFLLAAMLAPAGAAAQERTVSVAATATLRVANDSAGLGFSVGRERRGRGAALRAVAAGLRKVIAAVEAVPGVEAGDVVTGRISVRAASRGKRTVYRAGEGIAVTLHQPDRAGELVATAIAAGASGVSGPRFFVGDTELAARQALAAAFEKARERAQTLAAAAGATLGPALAIDEGNGTEFVPAPNAKEFHGPSCAEPETPAPPTARTPTAKSSAGGCGTPPPPTKPGTSTVTATVHAVFLLQ